MLLSRRVFWVAALVATVALTSVAQAQPGGGRGGRGFGGGFGGGGFGGGGFGGQSTFSLIGRESVQKDLALDADHTAKAKALSEKYGTATREEFQKLGRPEIGRDTPEEERNAKMKEFSEKAAAATKAIVDKLQPELDELLTDEQATRLEQIRVQALGGGAINDPVVAKALAITEEQKTKLASVRDDFRKKNEELMREAGFGRGQNGGGNAGAGNREEIGAKFTKLREEQTKATDEVLTAEQKEKLTSLKGKEFDVASLRGGFGGPGGGRGPGGPGGGRPRGEGRPKAE